ncbi:hypothetical protein V2G26_016226 [Clonostachys chloroleuca]
MTMVTQSAAEAAICDIRHGHGQGQGHMLYGRSQDEGGDGWVHAADSILSRLRLSPDSRLPPPDPRPSAAT